MTHNASNQLLTEDHSAVGRPPRGLTTWVYDAVGNRLSATSTAPGPSMLYATYTYATDDALLTEARTQSGAGYSLSTFSYDANGNRTLEEKGAQRFTYTWDPANRLAKITQAPGTGGDLTNQYRPDGLRSGGGTAMVWDGFDLLSEIRVSDGQIAPYYTRGNTLLKTRNDVTGNTEWFHLDEQGTRVQTSQTSGLPYPGMSDPGPWGEEPIVVTGAPTGAASWIADPGYYLEPKLARMLYYVRARWYPAGGPGWLSKDPIRSVNLYGYVGNQPLTSVDPSGLAAACSPRQRAVQRCEQIVERIKKFVALPFVPKDRQEKLKPILNKDFCLVLCNKEDWDYCVGRFLAVLCDRLKAPASPLPGGAILKWEIDQLCKGGKTLIDALITTYNTRALLTNPRSQWDCWTASFGYRVRGVSLNQCFQCCSRSEAKWPGEELERCYKGCEYWFKR